MFNIKREEQTLNANFNETVISMQELQLQLCKAVVSDEKVKEPFGLRPPPVPSPQSWSPDQPMN